ncbi:MAG TPA: FtsW/RodA/SpoVE family cell cycle protein [Acidimicrobiales bacterium]|jgi:peptidoglycan glycosyltransferase|nr:FtsW/RodA/SpoVE family cell cycle protein [Acidimicrobiales bacterium]
MTRAHRRDTELGLLLLVAIITAGAYVLASLGRTASLPANIGPLLGMILGLLAVAHVAVRRFAPNADGVLLPVAGLLNGLGYVFIARLDRDLARLQTTWTALGIVAFIATLIVVRRSRDLERYRYSFALLGVGLLMMPLLPVVGRNINGARLWVRFGPVNFQPGELAKIALAVFFAAYLVEKRELLSDFGKGRLLPQPRAAGPILLAWGFSLLVMTAEKDLGSSLLFFALFIGMLWIATDRGAYLVLGAGLFALGSLFAYSSFTHVQERVRIWLNPWPHAQDQAYQLVQGLYAMGSGGLAGSGIGLGSPQKIPAAATDFIFAAIGEETGLLGTVAVVAAFLVVVGVGLRIALRAEQPFEKLLAAGLTMILGVQTFIIIGGVTRIVPLTGITLPFVSYGGSSLVANYVLLALLLRISNDTVERRLRAEGVHG